MCPHEVMDHVNRVAKDHSVKLWHHLTALQHTQRATFALVGKRRLLERCLHELEMVSTRYNVSV